VIGTVVAGVLGGVDVVGGAVVVVSAIGNSTEVGGKDTSELDDEDEDDDAPVQDAATTSRARAGRGILMRARYRASVAYTVAMLAHSRRRYGQHQVSNKTQPPEYKAAVEEQGGPI
jgi:hypothetical protein